MSQGDIAWQRYNVIHKIHHDAHSECFLCTICDHVTHLHCLTQERWLTIPKNITANTASQKRQLAPKSREALLVNIIITETFSTDYPLLSALWDNCTSLQSEHSAWSIYLFLNLACWVLHKINRNMFTRHTPGWYLCCLRQGIWGKWLLAQKSVTESHYVKTQLLWALINL